MEFEECSQSAILKGLIGHWGSRRTPCILEIDHLSRNQWTFLIFRMSCGLQIKCGNLQNVAVLVQIKCKLCRQHSLRVPLALLAPSIWKPSIEGRRRDAENSGWPPVSFRTSSRTAVHRPNALLLLPGVFSEPLNLNGVSFVV